MENDTNNLDLYDNPQILHFIEDYLKEFTQKGIKLVIAHNHFYELFFDFQILSILNLNKYFTFHLFPELNSPVENNPHAFLFMDYDASNLLQFQIYNADVAILCNIVLSGLEFNEEFKRIIDSNCKLVFEGRIKISFFSTTIFQQKYLIELKLKDHKVDFHQVIKSHPIRALTILKSSFKYDLFKRNKFILSNEKIIFQPYFGGDKIFGEYQSIVIRFNMISDFSNYENLMNSIKLYKEVNKNVLLFDSLENFDSFLERDKMMNFLTRFHESEPVRQIESEFKAKLSFPDTLIISLDEVLNNQEFFSNVHCKGIKLPYLIKFKGECKKLSHTMILVLTDNCAQAIVQRLSKIQNPRKDIVCVFQTFVNHGGYIAKLYRFNNQVIINYRPSIPDVYSDDAKKIEVFKLGFWEYMTDNLGSADYKNFWLKFNNDKTITEIADQKLMLRVSELFEQFSHKTLFGLDFIYDKITNSYGLIDCNYFPGYKEIENDFNHQLTEHICFYLMKNK